MSRIQKAFAGITNGAGNGRRGFIPFITAGDPDLAGTLALLLDFAAAGATVIELGVPFSDPMADGPTIQRASERALLFKFGIAEILALVREVRKLSDVPIVLFGYYNPYLRFGLERLAREAAAAGVDGFLVVDLVPEESGAFHEQLRAHDLDMIFLIAPTSTDARLQLISELASGFVYAVSRAGVTGTRDQMSADAEALVTRMRKVCKLPLAVGFGVSTPAHIIDIWRYADAAVVGSAIVSEIERHGHGADMVQKVGVFVRSLLPRASHVD